MKIVTLRKIHRILGLIFAPFLLITAVTGGLLLWRNADVYGYRTTSEMLKWHNWEGLHAVGVRYLGVLLAAGLVSIVLTGGTLWVWMQLRAHRKQPHGAPTARTVMSTRPPQDN